jgi:diaminohydroxyphosphoribosylaminopyrimidine deaminase / 5-amino-6-(5-phosphoribosylamino)uracil reductase
MTANIFMQRALELAGKGLGAVAPNPMVGCVIVQGDVTVAEGYHQHFGGRHAEVEAIRNLPSEVQPSDCTLYVNLEPCSHFGKTPPCVDLIIKKGFREVVIANLDPNPLVAGQGIQKLKAAGVEVRSGVQEGEGRALNKRFFTFHEKKRPYYILKWAQTADGFISRLPVPANRKDNTIGDQEQQEQVHRMRSEEMGVLVGKNTVLCDNPQLSTRLVKGKNPWRIFIDRQLEVPKHYNIFDEQANTIIFNSIKSEQKAHLTWFKIDFEGEVLQQISEKLYQMQIQSVIVEGGAMLLNSFIEQKLYDEVKIFVNKNLCFGSGVPAPRY